VAVIVGGVLSMFNLRLALAVLPALSVAVAETLCLAKKPGRG
jgi:hypothetical protein